MRTAFVLLLAGVCALAIATPSGQRKYKVEDKALLQKQKDVLRLFNYVNQPSYYKEHVEIADRFTFEGHYDLWTQPEYVKEFWYMYQHDFLPQGEVFTVFNYEHLKQAVALFKTFYYAKDYETFYKTACWARNNVNEGMYIYALSVAVVHRDDMYGVVLPPIYEIYPHYFFNDEIIYKAQQYKQHYWGTYEHEEEIKDKDYKGYTIHANYSGWYMNVHPEQSMSYFTEDVGLNAYYYYYNLHYPFWMDGEEFDLAKDRRGEQYYYVHQQLLARYYLERLSNDAGEIPHFEYEYPVETGYYPSMHYTNGLHFPVRPNHANLYYHGVHGEQTYPVYGNYSFSYTYVKDYERRLRDAIDRGYIYTTDGKVVKLFEKEGFETLGNLVESNPDSPNSRFYGDLQVYARHLLGYAYYPLDDYKVAPSALEHFETSIRDPMFWQMYKRIMFYFHQYKSYLPHYTSDELEFDGVKIEGIEIDRLITYFDYFYSDLSNAVYVDEKEFNEDNFNIRARQYRLNHKPFNYKINVQSEKPTESYVKVFIGPKYDEYGREIDIEDNRLNFVEIDRFSYTLQAGQNVIERNSRQSFFVSDRTSYYDLYEHVMTSMKGGDGFHMDASETYWGMPARFLLPKGKVGGQTYQFYVIVSPYHGQAAEEVYPKIGAGTYYVDNHYPLGYPFDRTIEIEEDFFVPNSYFKDVVIYHKNVEEDINTTWSNY